MSNNFKNLIYFLVNEKIFITICCLFFSKNAFSEFSLPVDGNSLKQEARSQNIVAPELLNRKLVLSSFIDMPTHSFLISTGAGRADKTQVSQRVQYNTTFGPTVGINATYDFWTLTIGKRLSFVDKNDSQKYGQTNYDDFRLGYYIFDSLLAESYYQNYLGFYTDLTGQEGLQTSFGDDSTAVENDSSQSQESQIVKRSDVSALNYGLRLTAVLPLTPIFRAFASDKEKESMNWDFNWLTKLYYNRLKVSGAEPLVPNAVANSFSPIASLREYSSNTLGLGAGIGVVVPASPQTKVGFDAILGAGYQRQANKFIEEERVAYATAVEMNSNFFVNWKGNDHGFRFGLYLDSFSSKVKDVNFDSTSLGLNLLYSYYGLLL